ncbi:MAG: Dabb family protein [Lachnospirales bacterium]
MFNHYVSWSFKEDVNKAQAFGEIQDALYCLNDIIEGIVELKFIKTLKTSTCDVALISSFDNKNAYEAYAIHPKHLEAVEIIKKYLTSRHCIDF